MEKKEIRSISYKKLLEEDKTHQQTYDEIISSFGYKVTPSQVAKIVANTPSLISMNKTLALRYVLISLLGLILLSRVVLTILILNATGGPAIILAVVSPFILISPVLGIFGSVKGRADLMRMSAGLLIIGLVRSFTNGLIGTDVYSIISLVVYIGTILLLLYIPTLFKVNYQKVTKTIEVDEKQKSVESYEFTNAKNEVYDDLLDSL